MKKAKTIVSLLLGAALAIGAFTGCGSADSSDQASGKVDGATEQSDENYKTLKIGAGGTDDAVSLELANLAYDKGYLEDELNQAGYTAKIVAFQGAGPVINEALAAGEINAAVYGDFPAFTSKSNGIDTTVVATTNKKQQYGILATGNITSAKDLEGKKVIVPTGTVAQYYWEHYVKQYDIDASKVEIINTTDAASLLSTGEADAYAMTLPVLQYFSNLGMGSILEDSTQVNDGYTSYVFEVADSVLKEDPDVGVAINKALIRAYQDAVQNPQDLYDAVSSKQIGADCYAKEYEFDTSFEYLSPEITDESLSYYKNLNEWLYSHSLITEKVDLNSFLDQSYYKKAAEEIGQ